MNPTAMIGKLRWPTLAVIALAGVLGTLAWLGSSSSSAPQGHPDMVLPARPSGGQDLPAGAALQPVLDKAPTGAVFCLSPGDYAAPIVIRKPVTLWGPRSAVVHSAGTGSTVIVLANNVQLLGFTVDGSGDRPDLMDAGVFVHGDDVRVQGLRVVRALYGLAAEKSHRIAFVGNEIQGDPDTPLGLRGDGIHIWETHDSLVADNFVTDSRDVLVWYAPDSRIRNNTVQRGRYGTHFMYSHGSHVEGNRYRANTVGVFIMYSRNITLRDNLLAAAMDAGGMGLGLKESGNVTAENNRVVQNRVGIYLDRSPFQTTDTVTVRDNLFALCQTGVLFHAGTARTTVHDNVFGTNQDQVGVEGQGNVLNLDWRGNAFDDYQGYDLDGDGYGDVPYELRSFSNQLIGRNPDLAFFRGTPVLGLVESIGHLFPLFRPQPILIDPRPRMMPRDWDKGGSG